MRSLFRVKPYTHNEYKFVVRAKLHGKWKRRYFRSEAEAQAFATEQNLAESQRSSTLAIPHSVSTTPEVRRRKAIVTLGMHRSGTSALAGALAQAGVPFGHRLMPPAEENAKGFWEHIEIVRLHDRLLQELGSRWDDERPLPVGWEQSGAATAVASSLATIVAHDFAGQPIFGLKDPRLSRLLPLWLPIFDALEIDAHFFVLVREPWEVAQSLRRRNSFDAAKSYLLWLRYTFEAEEATRGHSRTILTFAELLKEGQRASQLILPHLGPAVTAAAAESAFRVFPERSLQHHDTAKAADASGVPSLAVASYNAFAALSKNKGAVGKIDLLKAQFEDSTALFQPRLTELEEGARRSASELRTRQQALDAKSQEITELRLPPSADLVDAQWEVLTLRAELLRAEERKREAIAKFSEAEDCSKAATSQRNQLRGMVVAMQADIEQERLNVSAVQHRLALAEQRAVAAEQDANALRDQLASVAAARDATEEKLRDLQQQLYAVEDRLDFTQKSLGAAERRTAASEDQLRAIRSQWKATQEQLVVAGAEAATRRSQIARLRERVAGRLILPFGKAQARLTELTN